jgi:chemotaxis protein MotB
MRVLVTVLFAATLMAGCGVPKSQYADLENQYKTAQTDLAAAKAETETAQKELQELREKNRKRTENFMSVYEDLLQIEAKNLAKVKLEDGRAVLQLESDVLFPSGSATLTPAGVTAVQEIAKALKETGGNFQVEGHTDNDPIKNSKEFPTNWHLGADRAINVAQEMVKAGFPTDRVSAATFSEFQPVADNTAADGKKQNRRIEVVWVPELSEVLPYKRMLREMKEREKEAGANTQGGTDTPAPAPAEQPKPQ